MPVNRYVVRVDPQGQTVVVDVLDTSGTSVVTYESPQFAAAVLTLPLTITRPTDFWLHDPGPYDVSCKVAGTEVAGAGAPKRVQVSDVPVLVVPDWERQRAVYQQVAQPPIQTSGALPTVTPSSGVGLQVSTTRDVQLYVETGTAGSVVVALSPDNVTYSTIYTKATAATDVCVVRVPAGWYVKLTATTAVLGTGTYY